MPDYRLDDLGWLQFEQLCQAMLKASIGFALEAWGGGADRGCDAYCDLPVRLTKCFVSNGPTVFQAKFVAQANAAGAQPGPAIKAAVSAECARIRKRILANEWSEPTAYVLLTNVPVSAAVRRQIRAQLRQELSAQTKLPACRVVICGFRDVCSLLDVTPTVRRSFPQLMSLADIEVLLERWVTRDVVERSQSAIAAARELAPVFIPTEAYAQAFDTLCEHHWAVMTGPPEMGKTAIARMIGVSRLSEGWQVFECLSPLDFLRCYNNDAQQVFIADDAFGSTEYKPQLADSWISELPPILRKLDAKHWLIWTSRPAPLKLALDTVSLQGPARQFPSLAEVLVDASALSLAEKAQMLYRHAKAATQDPVEKMLIRTTCVDIVRSPHFTPLRISRLVSEHLPELARLHDGNDGAIDELRKAVKTIIDQPTEQMRRSLERLDPAHLAVLCAVLNSGADAVREDELVKSFYALFGDDADVPPLRLVDHMVEHFLRRHVAPDQVGSGALGSVPMQDAAATATSYSWIHPSFRDLVIDFLVERPQPRRRFIGACSEHGVRLALSLGGGAVGERSLPFVADEQDWRLIGDRTQSIVAEPTCRSEADLMRAFASAVPVTRKDGRVDECAIDQAVRQVLISVAAAWQDRPDRLDADGLSAYVALSMLLSPLPALPDLLPLWIRAWDMARNQLSDAPFWLSELAEVVTVLLGVVERVLQCEPRLAKQQGFPGQYQDVLLPFLRELESYDSGCWSPHDRGNVESEIDSLDACCRICEELGSLMPDLNEAIAAAASNVSVERAHLQEELEELNQAEDESSEPPVTRAVSSTRGMASDEDAAIRMIFTDL